MGLGEHIITSWEDMRKFFIKNYQAYCRPRDSKEDTFRTTLKAGALKWFMGLGEHIITSWEDMRKFFIKKYQAYCRHRD